MTWRWWTHALAWWAACAKKQTTKAQKKIKTFLVEPNKGRQDVHISNTQQKGHFLSACEALPNEKSARCSPAAAACWKLLLLGAGTGLAVQLELLLGAGTGSKTAPLEVSPPSVASLGSDSPSAWSGTSGCLIEGRGGGGAAFFTDFFFVPSMSEASLTALLL